MTLKRDCVYFEPALPEQYRGWCLKLNKMIKGLNCNNCGYYKVKTSPDDLSRYVSKDLTDKLREDK